MRKHNSEGYYDPTTYEALRKVEQANKKQTVDFRTYEGYRPLVYICSPYAGDVTLNKQKAKKYSRYALLQNAIPLTPHLLYPQFMDASDPAEQKLLRHKIGYVLVGKCDELWAFGSVLSVEMECAIAVAKKRRMKIRYFTEELKEVMR